MNIALNRFLLLYTRFDNKRVKSNPKLLLPTQPHQWESIKIRWPSTKYNKTVDWYPGEANKNSGDEQNDDHATVDPATHRNSGSGHFILIFPAQFSTWCEIFWTTGLCLYWKFDVICQSSRQQIGYGNVKRHFWLVSFYLIPFWFQKGTFTYHDTWGDVWPVKCLVHLYCSWHLSDGETLMAWQNMIFVYLRICVFGCTVFGAPVAGAWLMLRDWWLDKIWYLCICVIVYFCTCVYMRIWMYGVRCTCSWRLTDGERLMTGGRPERGRVGRLNLQFWLSILPYPFPTFYKARRVGFGCWN